MHAAPKLSQWLSLMRTCSGDELCDLVSVLGLCEHLPTDFLATLNDDEDLMLCYQVAVTVYATVLLALFRSLTRCNSRLSSPIFMGRILLFLQALAVARLCPSLSTSSSTTQQDTLSPWCSRHWSAFKWPRNPTSILGIVYPLLLSMKTPQGKIRGGLCVSSHQLSLALSFDLTRLQGECLESNILYSWTCLASYHDSGTAV